jgi:hypothetical protein
MYKSCLHHAALMWKAAAGVCVWRSTWRTLQDHWRTLWRRGGAPEQAFMRRIKPPSAPAGLTVPCPELTPR